jgi:hypothetical protein
MNGGRGNRGQIAVYNWIISCTEVCVGIVYNKNIKHMFFKELDALKAVKVKHSK